MIARIKGSLVALGEAHLLVEVNGLTYEVLAPPVVLEQFRSAAEGTPVALVTREFLQIEQSRGTPMLVGFLSEEEREFFEHFLTVTGMGPRTALRAFSKPMEEIARAIEDGNAAFLLTLPGVGKQRAKEIIARLQGKVGHLAAREMPAAVAADADLVAQAMEVLLSLQFRRSEAQDMVRRALERVPNPESLEDLLPEVFR